MTKVIVIGGGISGLAAAWQLCRLTDPPEVEVLEQSGRVGGILLTGQLEGVTLDLGAESVLARRPEGVGLLRELGLDADVVHPATASSSVYSRGGVHTLPAGTVMGVPGDAEALAGILTAAETERVARERDLPSTRLDHDVDVASYVASRVGRAVVDRLVEPLLGGVYAGRADRLSMQASMPQLWSTARDGGSLLDAVAQVNGERAEAVERAGGPQPVFAGLRGGVGRLPLELARQLREAGVSVRTGVTARELTRTETGWRVVTGSAADPVAMEADAVVLAVPAAAAARLLRQECPSAASRIAGIETASVGVVAALVPRETVSGLSGSGVLVPPVETAATRGVKAVTLSSAKWAWVDQQPGAHAGHVVLRLSLGRAGETAVLQRDDQELTSVALEGLAHLVGRPVTARATLVQRWGGALPQYAVGHLATVASVRGAVAAVPGLAVCGAWLDGVGVAACIGAAVRAAAQVVPVPQRPTGSASPSALGVPQPSGR